MLILLLACIGRKYNFCKRPFEILITLLWSFVFSKKEALGKKCKTIEKLFVVWFHFPKKIKSNRGKLDFKISTGVDGSCTLKVHKKVCDCGAYPLI